MQYVWWNCIKSHKFKHAQSEKDIFENSVLMSFLWRHLFCEVERKKSFDKEQYESVIFFSPANNIKKKGLH